MKRWVEHYEELYSRETLVTKEALDAVESLPCMQELDQEPTMEDLMEAINILLAGKLQARTASQLKLLELQRDYCRNTCSTSYNIAGKKEKFRST